MRGAALLALVGALLAPAGATAAVPANDSPAGAGEFAPYTAENGTPGELTAVAELAEARPDRGVPRCLGASSFARTVWYRIPAAEAARELTVEASGETLDVLDLAAFVQDAGASPDESRTADPNACAGVGGGGADASEEPTAGLSLRVPAGRAVLVQVGRRGARGTPEDERAVLSLAESALPDSEEPAGDEAGARTPRVRGGRDMSVALGGATLTGEDPGQPACPSLGSVWRRYVPSTDGTRVVRAAGAAVGTLAVFAGARPGPDALDCVNREGRGALTVRVRARAGRPLWIRLGTDRPADDAEATLSVRAPR